MMFAKYVSEWGAKRRVMEVEYRLAPAGAKVTRDRYWSDLDVAVHLVDNTLSPKYQKACDNEECDFHFDKFMTAEEVIKDMEKRLKNEKWHPHIYPSIITAVKVPDEYTKGDRFDYLSREKKLEILPGFVRALGQ